MLKRTMRPAHPGAILKGMIEGLREESGQPYTVTEIAKGLGVSRRMLSMIVNQKSGVSSEMAVKLSEAFATNADLWQAEKKVNRETVRHFLQGGVGLQSA